MSLTPVGDWIARRYPPNGGATHWMGQGDDPGCCAGPHPACLYSAAWREALRFFASSLEGVAGTLDADEESAAIETLRGAARLAREKAQGGP